MSAHRITRVLNIRTLLTALAWLTVLATVLGASSALGEGSPSQATGMMAAATGATALFFLMALRRPRLRKITGVRRAGAAEIGESWQTYRREILHIAIFPAIGNLTLLWTSDPVLGRYAPTVPILVGTAVLFYALTVRTVRSMKGKAEGDAHPVLGVVLGSLLSASISLPALVFMALSWQAVVPCLIAGAATFAAALVTLWAASTAKN